MQDNPGTGSRHVYIAKIRGTSTYEIVKFLSRIGNAAACNCPNPGSVGIEYWKQSTTGVTDIQPLMRAENRKAVRLSRSDSQLTIAPLEKGPALNLLGQAVPVLP